MSIGARPTRQRRAVLAALAGEETFRTAQDIHALLRERGDEVGLTTVYRTLQALAEADEVDVVRTPDGESAYRQCSEGHHHHLLCRDCGVTVEIEGPAVEAWATRVATSYGFADVEHMIEIVGTCHDCSTRRQ